MTIYLFPYRLREEEKHGTVYYERVDMNGKVVAIVYQYRRIGPFPPDLWYVNAMLHGRSISCSIGFDTAFEGMEYLDGILSTQGKCHLIPNDQVDRYMEKLRLLL